VEVLADNFKEESKSNGYDTYAEEATQATAGASLLGKKKVPYQSVTH
jgi:hypothetical protein